MNGYESTHGMAMMIRMFKKLIRTIKGLHSEKKRDVYIELLKLGRERGLAGVGYDDLPEFLNRHGDLSGEEYDDIDRHRHDTRKISSESARRKLDVVSRLFEEAHEYIQGNDRRYLNINAYFQLLEFEELELARKNAQSAKWYSSGAIMIAVASLIVSVVLGISDKPVMLDSIQYQGLTDTQSVTVISSQLDVLNVRVDTIAVKVDELIAATERASSGSGSK